MGKCLIDRFYLKDCLTFKEVDIEFDKNLIVFSGASGAGKSVLLNAMLSLFGFKESQATTMEAALSKDLALDEYGIESDDPNVFRFSKAKNSRYFINNQLISKKILSKISKDFIEYLSLREYKEFENENLLFVLDSISIKEDGDFTGILQEYSKYFNDLQSLRNELQKIEDEQKKVEDFKEFAQFEINKIDEISPQKGEYEELLSLKKTLSKKEKIEEAVQKASSVLENEYLITEALGMLDEDSSFFDETMNQLRIVFENASDKLNELNEADIENILDRIEKLSYLKNRYGGIEEALLHREKKLAELEYYENIEFEKKDLEERLVQVQKKVDELSGDIHEKRVKALPKLQQNINKYLKMLYLNDIKLELKKCELHTLGYDCIKVGLGNVDFKKISTGELNRVKLAFIAASNEYKEDDGGILVLDEVDANLSGKESMSVAKVLKFISKNHQIFAISHHPQLSSVADMHFLVSKENDQSSVTLLEGESRTKELARMISADKISDKALDFAKSLLGEASK